MNISMHYKGFVAICIMLFIQTSCAYGPKIILDDFQPVDIQKSDTKIPSFSELYLKRNTTVIVAPFEVEGIEPARIISKSNLPTTITGALEKYLSQTGVQIYDGNEVEKEVLINNAKKNELLLDKTSRHIMVDYVIFSRLNSLDIFSEYMPSYQKKSWFSDQMNQYPARCKYTIHFCGTIRIYDGVTRAVVKSIEIRKEETYTIETTQKCFNDSDFVVAMTRKTAEDAIKKSRIDLQYFFSPNAYVKEIRRHKDIQKYIVQITCGKKRLLTNHSTVNFYSLVDKSDNQFYFEEKTGSGKITNQIDEELSWVLLDDPNTASRIKQWDIAKVKYHKSFFQMIFDFIRE